MRVESKNRWFHLLPGFSLAIVLIQILVEGHRWQMYPIYVYAVFLFALTFKNMRFAQRPSDKPKSKGNLLFRIVGGISNVLLLVVIAMPPLLLPVFKLPIPTGPYNVGTRYDYFIDKNRPEPLTPDSTDFQEISVQVWYPAEISSDDRPVAYWENASEKSEIISRFWGGLPTFFFSHFSLVRTHYYLDANLSKTEWTYPVLIFNQGSIGLPSLNTVLMQDLASNGFIVFAIGHSDHIPFFVKPDGTIRAFDPASEALQAKMRENDGPEVRSTAKQELLLRKFLEKNPHNQKSLFRWVEDISFAIDELERLNSGKGFFIGKA
ncbi:MAG: hypothetical protein FJ217_08815 [Ignavibacteria bacterium]|nr:hypothetical protein [Ignavibacteria bacterium]